MIVVIRRDEKLYNYSFAVTERPDPHAAAKPAEPVTGTPTLSTAPAAPGRPVLVNHVVNDSK